MQVQVFREARLVIVTEPARLISSVWAIEICGTTELVETRGFAGFLYSVPPFMANIREFIRQAWSGEEGLDDWEVVVQQGPKQEEKPLVHCGVFSFINSMLSASTTLPVTLRHDVDFAPAADTAGVRAFLAATAAPQLLLHPYISLGLQCAGQPLGDQLVDAEVLFPALRVTASLVGAPGFVCTREEMLTRTPLSKKARLSELAKGLSLIDIAKASPALASRLVEMGVLMEGMKKGTYVRI